MSQSKLSSLLRAIVMVVLALTVFSLSFSARLRLGGAAFHTGGAEASIAPLDFPLFALLLLSLFIVLIRSRVSPVRIGLVELGFLVFLLGHLPSLWIAPDRQLALLELMRLLKMGILLLLMQFFVQTDKDLQYVVYLLIGAVAVQGVLAIVQSVTQASLGLGVLGEQDAFWVQSGSSFSFGRAGGTLGHPNVLANFGELLLPLLLATVLTANNRRKRWFALIAFALGLVAVFLTFSRAGWASILVGIVLVLGTGVVNLRGRFRVRSIRYAAIVLSGLGIGVFVFASQIVGRLATYNTNSWIFRFATYKTALNIIRAHPFLGVGINNYKVVSEMYASSDLPVRLSSAAVHNAYLLLAAESGLLGLTTFVLLLIAVFIEARQVIRAGLPVLAPTAVGLLIGLVAFMLHASLDWLFRYDPVYTLIWFSIAVIAATRNIAWRRSQSVPHLLQR